MTQDTKTIALVQYPGLTPLDLVGPLQVLSVMARMRPEYEVAVVAEHTEPVDTDTPVRLAASHTFADVPQPYGLLVPGGLVPTMRAMTHEPLLAYLRRAAATAEITGSVCTGSLVLGAAGLLDGRRATTHWAFLDVLAGLGAIPVAERWVEDGEIITAAGVAAGIDMAIHLAARLGGEDIARQVQYAIEYDPQPPMGGLNWTEAPRDLWTPLRDHALKEGLGTSPDLLARIEGHLPARP